MSSSRTETNTASPRGHGRATGLPARLAQKFLLCGNFAITGNFIGGSAPNGGGTAWTTTGTTATYLFQGIRLAVGSTTVSSVQGNTIVNIVWTSSANNANLPGVWSGIYVTEGNVNIGTVTGNTIGSGTGTGSISVTSSGSGGTFGIASQSSGTVAIANNSIGSVTVNGSASTISASLTGIQVTAGANTITGNTVGSTTTANSLNAATASNVGAAGQQVRGIVTSSSTSASITGNTVANLNNNAAGFTVVSLHGILATSGVNTITGNTVRNLSFSGGSQTKNGSFSGISSSASAAGQTVSQNTVHSLTNTRGAGSANHVVGIFFNGPTSGVNVISRNLVHSLALANPSATSTMNGMFLQTGTFTAQNNLVRVGLDATGTSTAATGIVRGINDNPASATAGRNFYHNSVYVGGTATSGAVNTFAFTSTSVSNARTFQNNLFVNARSNSGGTGKHYAVSYGGTTVNPTGLTAGGNIFLASGTGGVFGHYNSADRADLSAWQAATGQDATSYNVNPRFINPTGTAATVDLHLQTVNPAEAHGVALAAVTDDFDGQTRSSLTPVDIGADAGNFIYAASSTEQNPVISYTPLGNATSTANRVLGGFATITDDVSVAGGGEAPRLYFKKSTEADAFVGNTPADNGWKYVTAGNVGSPYDFTVDYALLTSSAGGGEVIQYFVVAQDGAGNFASSPTGASYSNAAAPVTTINARPATVQSYRIVNADLSALTLSSGTLAPGFAANLTTYTATVANSVSSLLVTPTPADPTATVTVNGSTPASPVGLSVGANTLTIVVTASDSTTKTYTVTVTRADSSAPDIAVTQTIAVADGGSVAFGSVNVGSSSAPLTFTITNSGTADLTGLVVTKDGADNAAFTISALSGTSIPAGAGTVMFTVTFSPTAPAGAKTAALHIASNVTGPKNPYDIGLTGTALNAPPVANAATYTRAANTSLKISIAHLLATFTSDPDSDARMLTGIGTSAQGATVSIAPPWILYSPANNNNDSFSYTINDGNGHTATGTIRVTVVPLSGKIGAFTLNALGKPVVQFAGIPGYRYTIERSPDMTAWAPLQTLNAPTNGTFTFTDLTPLPSSGFYRMRYDP